MPEIKIVTSTDELATFCAEAASAPYVTVDTEFLRERTYYAKLCLIQLAIPPAGEMKGKKSQDSGGPAILVDPLAEDLDLAPLYDLFRNENVVKVFHAARQDLEIFYHATGTLPTPLFDTQVAAMVCGFGEQVGYETLVKRIAKASLDKSSRFTDWSRRPLSPAQQSYALADVTHLRVIYEHLQAQLRENGRESWLGEEMATMNDPATYVTEPEDAWLRVRVRNNTPRFLAIVRELARFREDYAQTRDVPRSRVFKDDVLIELASTKPKSESDLGKSRLLQREARKGEIAEGILAAVAAGLATDDLPASPKDEQGRPGNPALSDLLRVLLKAKSDDSGVAAKLIATASDLDALASGARDLPVLKGWRAEVFGDDAKRLAEGKLALGADGGVIKLYDL